MLLEYRKLDSSCYNPIRHCLDILPPIINKFLKSFRQVRMLAKKTRYPHILSFPGRHLLNLVVNLLHAPMTSFHIRRQCSLLVKLKTDVINPVLSTTIYRIFPFVFGFYEIKGTENRALFSSPRNPKNFQDSPSHRILRHMHEALNIDENKN